MSRTEIESAISKIYATRQFESQQDFENRLRATLQNPEFKALYVKHRELSLKKLNNKSNDIEEEYAKTSKALLNYIENNKIDLNIYHKCPKCNDTGMTKDGMCDCKKALLVNNQTLLARRGRKARFSGIFGETVKVRKVGMAGLCGSRLEEVAASA